MEDSIEHYIRVSKSKTNQIASDETFRKHAITQKQKEECELRARKIVELLMNGKLQLETFTSCLHHIDQAHYQDVVEERALTKLCGYCLCNKKVPDMPKKQYFISTKENKVYDITDRKNYCSNFCYGASGHIKKQVDTSPLWLRNPEKRSKFTVLSPTKSVPPGDVVVQGMYKATLNEEELDSIFNSISTFTELSLNEMIEMEQDKKCLPNKFSTRKVSKTASSMNTINEGEEMPSNIMNDVDKFESYTLDKKNDISEKCDSSNVCDKSEKPGSSKKNKEEDCGLVNTENTEKLRRINQDIFTRTISNQKRPIKISSKYIKNKSEPSNTTVTQEVLDKVRIHVHEWITLETYIFLYGETKIKEVLNDEKFHEYFEKLKIDESQRNQHMRYMEICRKLHLKQLADEKFDNAILAKKLQPIPDYKQLKEESKNLNLKVRSFFEGEAYEVAGSSKQDDENRRSDPNREEVPAFLPLSDTKSQMALRRKIYLNSLNKAVDTLERRLDISTFSIISDVADLSKTFHLQAHNITFKPQIWNVIGFIVIKLLCIRDSSLKMQLENEEIENRVTTFLNCLPNGLIFVTNLLQEIEDVSTFVEKYITADSV